MSWLNFTGHTAADFPMDIRGGGSISPYLLQRHDPYAEIFKTLAPAIKDYLQQQKSDQIANELMNMENPPRAEAVDPSLQGAPATAPARGGQQAYKAQKLYQDYLSNQPDTATDDLNYQILWNKAHPDQTPDETGMTPYQREQTRLRELEINRKLNNPRGPTAKADPWENTMAVARGEGEGANFKGSENGSMVKLVTPSGYSMIVPWASYQAKQQQPVGAQIYQSRVQGDQPLPAPDLPPVTAPEPTLAPAAKQLDAATAKAILAEAGGDKEKARQIARERGYSF